MAAAAAGTAFFVLPPAASATPASNAMPSSVGSAPIPPGSGDRISSAASTLLLHPQQMVLVPYPNPTTIVDDPTVIDLNFDDVCPVPVPAPTKGSKSGKKGDGNGTKKKARRKKPPPPGQPPKPKQRGMGVEKLEKIRLKERWDKFISNDDNARQMQLIMNGDAAYHNHNQNLQQQQQQQRQLQHQQQQRLKLQQQRQQQQQQHSRSPAAVSSTPSPYYYYYYFQHHQYYYCCAAAASGDQGGGHQRHVQVLQQQKVQEQECFFYQPLAPAAFGPHCGSPSRRAARPTTSPGSHLSPSPSLPVAAGSTSTGGTSTHVSPSPSTSVVMMQRQLLQPAYYCYASPGAVTDVPSDAAAHPREPPVMIQVHHPELSSNQTAANNRHRHTTKATDNSTRTPCQNSQLNACHPYALKGVDSVEPQSGSGGASSDASSSVLYWTQPDAYQMAKDYNFFQPQHDGPHGRPPTYSTNAAAATAAPPCCSVDLSLKLSPC